jgi:hypothetical protein
MENTTKIIEKENRTKTIARVICALTVAIVWMLIGALIGEKAAQIIVAALILCLVISALCIGCPSVGGDTSSDDGTALEHIVFFIFFFSLIGSSSIEIGQYIAQCIASRITMATLWAEWKEVILILSILAGFIILVHEYAAFNKCNEENNTKKGIVMLILIAITAALLLGGIYAGCHLI